MHSGEDPGKARTPPKREKKKRGESKYICYHKLSVFLPSKDTLLICIYESFMIESLIFKFMDTKNGTCTCKQLLICMLVLWGIKLRQMQTVIQ